MSKPIPRPDVLGVAYKLLNKVDVHNQGRQDLIRLERSWPTQNCWFRQFCFGMGAIGENAHIMGNIVGNEKITHDTFVKRLAFQMATVKEIEYVDENGTQQILKRPAKVTMTVSMAVARSWYHKHQF